MSKKTSRKKRAKGHKAKPPHQPKPQLKVSPLDYFTNVDLKRWKRNSDLLIEYHFKYYYCLESQRAANYNKIIDALRKSFISDPLIITDWIRIVSYKRSLQPLSSLGSLEWVGSRFNIGLDVNPEFFPAFNALYLAETSETAMREKFGMAENETRDSLSRDEVLLMRPNSYSHIRLHGEIHHYFDLTKPSKLKPLIKIINNFTISAEVKNLAKILNIKTPCVVTNCNDLQKVLLIDGWREHPVQFNLPSNPQIFGKMLLDAGFEGILYPSTKGKGKCLALFLNNFEESSSYISLMDDPPNQDVITTLNSSTYKKLM